MRPRRVVLVVDDQAMTRDVVGAMLDGDDEVEVHTAPDAEAALALAESLRPDVVVLDVTMPEMDGFETLRRLRSLEGLDELPAIFLSARVLPEDVEAGRAAGATYLTKPFSAVALLNAIERLVQDDGDW